MWVRSAEFALKFGLNKKSLEKSCFRASAKKFCLIKSHILAFRYTAGIGRAGRVLMIWDTPFESEGEAAEFVDCHEPNGSRNDEKPQTPQNTMDCHIPRSQ